MKPMRIFSALFVALCLIPGCGDKAPKNPPTASQVATAVTNLDTDGDGIPDIQDAFPRDPEEWADTDSDGTGDGADTDDDNDGVADSVDAFPLNAGEHTDTDGDGTGDNADPDDDDDGFPDLVEAVCGSSSLLASEVPADSDADGMCDVVDIDEDNDGVPNWDEQVTLAISNMDASVSCAPGASPAFTPDTPVLLSSALTYASTANTTCGFARVNGVTGHVSGTCPASLDGCHVEVAVVYGNQVAAGKLYVRPNRVRFVGPEAKGAMNGTSWNDVTTSVQAAATALGEGGGSIWIAQGVYYSASTAGLANLPSNVNLYGGFSGTEELLAERGVPDASLTLLSGDTDRSGTHSAPDAYHVVQVSGNNLIDGLSITMGNAASAAPVKDGGGVLVNSGRLILNNVRILNNNAYLNGGGISLQGGSVYLTSAVFSGNIANFGGAINLESTAYAAVTDATFADNTALYGAAIRLLEATLKLYDSVVTANTATLGGGGLTSAGQAKVHLWNNRFYGNAAPEGAAMHVFQGDVGVYHTDFVGNAASTAGGAIKHEIGGLRIYDSAFRGNTSPVGGAIFSYAGVLLARTVFSGNQALGGGTGGAIVSAGELAISGSTFTDNSASDLGGAVRLDGSSASITTTTFSGNTSLAGCGGAMYSNSANLYFGDVTFANNTGDYGGGACLIFGSAVLERVSATGNKANYGAGVFLGNALATITDAEFALNTAAVQGGAITIESANATLANSTFLNNNSAQIGGALEIKSGSSVTVTGSVLQRNLSELQGGAVHADNSYLMVFGSRVTDNTSQFSYGGGIDVSGGTLKIVRSLVEKNTSGGPGGGVAVHSAAAAMLIDSVLAWNAASGGGAAFSIWGAASTFLTNTTVAYQVGALKAITGNTSTVKLSN